MQTIDEAIVQFDTVIDKDSKEEGPTDQGSDNPATGKAEPEESNGTEDMCINLVTGKEATIEGTTTSQKTNACNEKQLAQQPAACAMDTATDKSTQCIPVIQS